jgi:histidine triad (HIT) family protein
MDCVFCKIVSGELPSYKFWEDQDHIAFLDINPIREGHTLVIPKKHFVYLFDMEDEIVSGLIKSSKKVAEVLKASFQPKTQKIGIIVYGLDVDHTHIHMVPIDQPGDLTLANRKPASPEELQATINKIKPHLGESN